MPSLEAASSAEENENVFSSDPVVLQLNRLENQLKDKCRELGDAHAEIKASRLSQALLNKALQQLNDELQKLDEKLRIHDSLVENKNLEIKKLTSEKKEALAAQYAAEATLRRVYANQKDEDVVPVEAIIAPLEADIKMFKNEIMTLREDKKALERATKLKESALLESEMILKSALERATIVEEVQNHNMELKRQIEICQEENRILDKTNRLKVSEIEKLTRSIQELEESILASAASANAIRDYQRQLSQLNEEKKSVERELARAKVSANRVAKVVSNEWKNDDDKVMPIKLWLEERRLLQAELQRFKDKLGASERRAKAEAQLKDKFRWRLRTMEEALKHEQSEKPSPVLGCLKNGGLEKRCTSQPNVKAEAISAGGDQLKHLCGENMSRKNLWACRSKVLDRNGKENTNVKQNVELDIDSDSAASGHVDSSQEDVDVVSGFLYDRLQREVISLLKYCEEKDATLSAKDEEIKVLTWKVDAVTKAMQIESRKLKRETTAMEKSKVDNLGKQKFKSTDSPTRNLKHLHV